MIIGILRTPRAEELRVPMGGGGQEGGGQGRPEVPKGPGRASAPHRSPHGPMGPWSREPWGPGPHWGPWALGPMGSWVHGLVGPWGPWDGCVDTWGDWAQRLMGLRSRRPLDPSGSMVSWAKDPYMGRIPWAHGPVCPWAFVDLGPRARGLLLWPWSRAAQESINQI